MTKPEDYKTRNSYNTEGHAHELTFSSYKRHQFLLLPRIRDEFVVTLNKARTELDFKLLAYVLMPDHCHLLIYPQSNECTVERILHKIKLSVSKKAFHLHPEIREACTVPSKVRSEYRFWEAGGGYDRNITSHEAVLNVLEYFHQNPVKKELCERPIDWLWSSARAYEGLDSIVRIDRYEP